MAVLVEFLAMLLDSAARASEQRRSKHAQPDPDSELRMGLRLQVLQLIFVESALIQHLFKLLSCGVAQFESAALLLALLTHASMPQRCLGSALEPLLGHFLPQIELLSGLLQRNAGKATKGSNAATGGAHKSAQAKRELRLNAYTVKEPLGALRVAAVQILAALADLAPERALSGIKPQIWTLLVQWFLAHRCNHIFQAACGRLFIAVIQHGNTRLQHLVLVKLKLLSSIFETVLAEGACGDRWHELRPEASAQSLRKSGARASEAVAGSRVEKSQVSISRKRHPGGLGGMKLVIEALARQQRGAADEAAAAAINSQKAVAGSEGTMVLAANRAPLAPRAAVPQATRAATPFENDLISQKPMGHTPHFVARLLAENANWPQVIGAVGRNTGENRPAATR